MPYCNGVRPKESRASEALFGVSAPLAKRLLPDIGPMLRAGIFYLGAGAGLT